MSNLRSLLLSVMALGAIGGCSSSLQAPGSDAGRDATSSIDRPMDRAHDGGGELDAHDGGLVCPPLDLASRCLSWNGCQPTWTGVLAHPFCQEGLANFGDAEFRYDCGAYLVRSVIVNVDAASYTYYYDATTGMLAAIFDWVGCVGGPPGGIAARCGTGQQICSGDGVLADGGSPTDSSSPSDGGSPCEAGVCLDGGSRG